MILKQAMIYWNEFLIIHSVCYKKHLYVILLIFVLLSVMTNPGHIYTVKSQMIKKSIQHNNSTMSKSEKLFIHSLLNNSTIDLGIYEPLTAHFAVYNKKNNVHLNVILKLPTISKNHLIFTNNFDLVNIEPTLIIYPLSNRNAVHNNAFQENNLISNIFASKCPFYNKTKKRLKLNYGATISGNITSYEYPKYYLTLSKNYKPHKRNSKSSSAELVGTVYFFKGLYLNAGIIRSTYKRRFRIKTVYKKLFETTSNKFTLGYRTQNTNVALSVVNIRNYMLGINAKETVYGFEVYKEY